MTDNILISIHNIHVNNILKGNKTIELRKRPIHVKNGTGIWIYNTMPFGRLEAYAIISNIDTDTPEKIWLKYQEKTGISKKAYDKYFCSSHIACAIELDGIQKIKQSLDLHTIRKELGKFHPPQFFKRLQQGSKELQLFEKVAC